MPRIKLFFMLLATSLCWFTAHAQVQKVTGTVSSSDGGTLPGVSVVLKGTRTGTVTDGNGKFAIDASAGGTLVFSYLGYEPQEIVLKDNQAIAVQLAVSRSKLNEVVVTALGIKRDKKALGYSVGEIKGDDLTETDQGNVLNAMAGRVAGVRIAQMDGTAGSSVNIIIRGATSLHGDNQPLFVIDGVPVMNQLNNAYQGADLGNAISDLNPDDIESISVLKGASAAALYGSRAGNGVVLITTKTKGGKGLGVSFNSSFVDNVPYDFVPVQNKFASGKSGAHVFEEGENESWGSQLDVGNEAVQWNSDGQKIPLVSYPNRFKDFFGTGQTFTNNISVTGNNDKGSFRLSLGDMRSSGIIPNTNLKRTTMNLNATYKLTDKLSITGSFNWNNSRSDNRPNIDGNDRNDIVRSLYEKGAQVNILDLKNYWVPGMEGTKQLQNAAKQNNVWFLANENTNSFKRDRLISKVQMDWDMTPDLKLTSSFARDGYQEGRESKRAFSTYGQEKGGYDVSDLNREETNIDLNLSYTKQLDKNWNIYALVGANRMYQYGRTLDNYASQLVIPELYSISNGVPGTVTYNSSWYQKAIYSIYGLASVGFKDMVYLEVTGRNDWSSTLPVENRSYFYPSASLSVILSEMFTMPDWISYMKLRGGIAELGNDTDPYGLYQYFSVGPDWGTAKELYMGGSLKNPTLLPEQALSKEVGAEFRLFHDKVGLDVGYYISGNKNQILSIGLPVESGATSKMINAGLVESRGWEIGLNVTPIANKNFKWDMSFNFSRNRTTLKELAEGLTNFEFVNNSGLSVRTYEGGLIGDMYESPMLTVTDKNSPYYGYPILAGNGTYQTDNDPSHVVKIGNSNQDFTLGFQPTLTYKAFSLSANIDWSQGGSFFSETRMFLQNNGQRTDTYSGTAYDPDVDIVTQIKDNPAAFFGKWVGGRTAEYGGFPWPTANGRVQDASFNVGVREVVDGNGNKSYIENLGGQDTKWLDPFTANRYASRPFADRNLYNATYVKIRELTLTYHIPKALTDRIHLQRSSIGVFAANFFEWTAAGVHIDPERAYQVNGGAWSQGVEYYNAMPWTASFGIKLNINF